MQHRVPQSVRSPWRSAVAILIVLVLAGAVGAGAQSVVRGPYLQNGSDTAVTVKWRTDSSTDSRVRYGSSPTSLDLFVDVSGSRTRHEVTLTGLSPDTVYFYSVGTTAGALSGGDSQHFFLTAPIPGVAKPTRIWAIGDSGTADGNARAVRDAYASFTGSTHTDLWLMLGDNAYNDGTDTEYQAAVFNTYPDLLKKSVLWPTLGNHDGRTATSSTQSGPYYEIFTLPTQGEAGGVPSGTEAYYSFDYGNIHFVVLESHQLDRTESGAMLTWLVDDLLATTADWVIAFWHHPPYSKGSHNSDNTGEVQMVEMRQNALPILESHGVDLVLTGHSHSYERSFLIDGHYGFSSSLDSTMILDGGDGNPDGDGFYEKATLGPAPNEGAVYIVAGNAGKISGGQLNHPAMQISLNELGSVVLDVDGNVLVVTHLDGTGQKSDSFAIVKGGLSSVCGNGVREFGEECDGGDLAGATCGSLSCTGGGTLGCTASCTYDTSLCLDCPICDNDFVCEAGESCDSCPSDCPSDPGATCGNGVCEAGNGENCVSCPSDCNGKQNGKPSGRFCCGDGGGENPLSCSDALCSSGGWLCSDAFVAPGCCGDGACTGNEDSFTCELDCGPPPTCGDGSCDPTESACSCSADCGLPPVSEIPGLTCSDGVNNDCDASTDCNDSDCGTDPACSGSCSGIGASCSIAGDCCSGKCKGPAGGKTCK